MLEHFRASQEVGFYSSAFKLVEGMFFVPSIFIGTLFPFLCETNEDSRISDSSHFLFKKAFLFLLAIAVIVALIFSVWAGKIILFLYGSQYMPAVDSLKVLAWVLVFVFLNELFFYTFLSVEKQKTVFFVMSVSMVAYIILCLVLIPGFGSVGSSWALLLTQFVLFSLNVILMRRLR